MSVSTAPAYAKVGPVASLWRTNISRDQRYRGMAEIRFGARGYEGYSLSKYGILNLNKVRAALDTITLEDENAVVKVPIRLNEDEGWDNDEGGSFIRFSRGKVGDKVRLRMPCGETRVYRVSTIDRALSELGY